MGDRLEIKVRHGTTFDEIYYNVVDVSNKKQFRKLIIDLEAIGICFRKKPPIDEGWI